MRTTLTLDADLAAKLKAEARQSGRSFRAVVNDKLRQALRLSRVSPQRPFKIKPLDLGTLKPGLSLDCIPELIEQVEGPVHR
jgi:hypothetical protein